MSTTLAGNLQPKERISLPSEFWYQIDHGMVEAARAIVVAVEASFVIVCRLQVAGRR